jgi:hypothetical protein
LQTVERPEHRRTDLSKLPPFLEWPLSPTDAARCSPLGFHAFLDYFETFFIFSSPTFLPILKEDHPARRRLMGVSIEIVSIEKRPDDVPVSRIS